MHRPVLLCCGMALVGWAFTTWLELPGANIPRYVGLALAAWLVWLLAVRITLGLPAGDRRRDLALIFAIGLAMRLILGLTPASLSDDVYRAVWDARLVHAGINPYQYAPAAPELAPLRDEAIWPRVNHPEQHTPYPPLAEVLGALAYAVLPERLTAMQVLFGGLDLVAAGLLCWLLQRLGYDSRRCIVLAWSPLSALHAAHSAHNDSAMVAAMVAAVLLLSFQRRWLSMAMLGAATMVKRVPALMVPSFARATGRWAVLSWVASCALLTMPFLGAGAGLVAGVASEGGGQAFNDSAHLVVERVMRPLTGPEVASRMASISTVAVTLAVAAIAGLSDRRVAEGVLVAGTWVWVAYLLSAPVVQPWYLSWLAPLISLTVRPGAGWWPFRADATLAWLWWSGTVTLTELTYLPGGRDWWVAIRSIEYGPVYVLLGLSALRWWRDAQGRHRAGVSTGHRAGGTTTP